MGSLCCWYTRADLSGRSAKTARGRSRKASISPTTTHTRPPFASSRKSSAWSHRPIRRSTSERYDRPVEVRACLGRVRRPRCGVDRQQHVRDGMASTVGKITDLPRSRSRRVVRFGNGSSTDDSRSDCIPRCPGPSARNRAALSVALRRPRGTPRHDAMSNPRQPGALPLRQSGTLGAFGSSPRRKVTIWRTCSSVIVPP